MPLLFPTQGTLSDAFSPRLPFGSEPPQRQPSSADRYPAWSTVEGGKSNAGTLSKEAQSELRKASQTLQEKTGEIQLHSAKYYAACTFGGLIACVGSMIVTRPPGRDLRNEIGLDPCSRNALRLSKMSTSGEFKDVQGQFRSLGQDCSSRRLPRYLHWLESHPFWLLCIHPTVRIDIRF